MVWRSRRALLGIPVLLAPGGLRRRTRARPDPEDPGRGVRRSRDAVREFYDVASPNSTITELKPTQLPVVHGFAHPAADLLVRGAPRPGRAARRPFTIENFYLDYDEEITLLIKRAARGRRLQADRTASPELDGHAARHVLQRHDAGLPRRRRAGVHRGGGRTGARPHDQPGLSRGRLHDRAARRSPTPSTARTARDFVGEHRRPQRRRDRRLRHPRGRLPAGGAASRTGTTRTSRRCSGARASTGGSWRARTHEWQLDDETGRLGGPAGASGLRASRDRPRARRRHRGARALDRARAGSSPTPSRPTRRASGSCRRPEPGSVPAGNREVRFLLARGWRLEQIARASRFALPADAADVAAPPRGRRASRRSRLPHPPLDRADARALARRPGHALHADEHRGADGRARGARGPVGRGPRARVRRPAGGRAARPAHGRRRARRDRHPGRVHPARRPRRRRAPGHAGGHARAARAPRTPARDAAQGRESAVPGARWRPATRAC